MSYKNLYDAYSKHVKNKPTKSHGKDFFNLPCFQYKNAPSCCILYSSLSFPVLFDTFNTILDKKFVDFFTL